ncbi:MAG: SgcJ/EcaC family oxidoreductase [Hyphomicrobiaceae bacterium]|nr:SgcJ/EcaC family oxidoreductase [Hyphomicrobiaceae bacterium]
MSAEQEITEAVQTWIAALNAMLNGDPEPFADVYSHADDASYMSADGTFRVGWDAIFTDWKFQAEKALGGHTEYSGLHVIDGGDMAVAQYRLSVNLTGPDKEPSTASMRETSVYRREEGGWKIAAHHADDFSLWEKIVTR